MKAPRARAAAGIAAATLALASCGVPAEDQARRLAAEDVPYGLLEQAPPTTSTFRTPTVPKVGATVYLLAAGRLRAVPRQVTAPATIAKVLSALLTGPDDAELTAGLRSAINPSASLLPRRAPPETVSIDLSAEFVQAPVSDQVLGLAQIVYTVTELPGVAGVTFTLDGEPIAVPIPSGTTVDPVGRDAFAGVAPLPPDPTAPQ
ncbi:MAG TPA: GerMN domain-containing protein [Acidimicrobiales bacterium]|nr:GerMN domain-containing protein [Acidimicrobiales bacterium]